MKLSVFVGVFGLMLDIIGAYYLARGFIKKAGWEMANEAVAITGQNPFIVLSMAKQKAEAIAGFFVMMLGFLGQVSAYLVPDKQPPIQISLLYLVLYLLGPIIFLTLPKIIDHLKNKYLEDYNKSYSESLPGMARNLKKH